MRRMIDTKQGAWITPTLINGWKHNADAPLQYRKNQFGKVEFRGRIEGGTADTAFTTPLPVGYRPEQYSRFILSVSSSTFGLLLLGTNGSNAVYGVSTGSGASFDNVSYYVG